MVVMEEFLSKGVSKSCTCFAKSSLTTWPIYPPSLTKEGE